MAAMLLQMVGEKLAKAALLRSGLTTVEKARSSHMAASHMRRVLANTPGKCKLLGFNHMTVRQFLFSLVNQLESSHPQLVGANDPHLESPWLDASGAVRWPAQHLDVARSLGPSSTMGALLVTFLTRLSERFDEVFPES